MKKLHGKVVVRDLDGKVKEIKSIKDSNVNIVDDINRINSLLDISYKSFMRSLEYQK